MENEEIKETTLDVVAEQNQNSADEIKIADDVVAVIEGVAVSEDHGVEGM